MRFLALLLLLIPCSSAFAAGDIFDAARSGDIPAINAYIAAKENLEIRTGRGYTPFILAAYYGQNDALATLKKAGAANCALDETGNTAFMGVAFRGHTHTAKWLVANTDCDINHQNHAGQTALMMASLFGREEIIQLLLSHGAKIDLVDAQGNSAASLAKAQGLEKVVKMLTFPMQK